MEIIWAIESRSFFFTRDNCVNAGESFQQHPFHVFKPNTFGFVLTANECLRGDRKTKTLNQLVDSYSRDDLEEQAERIIQQVLNPQDYIRERDKDPRKTVRFTSEGRTNPQIGPNTGGYYEYRQDGRPSARVKYDPKEALVSAIASAAAFRNFDLAFALLDKSTDPIEVDLPMKDKTQTLELVQEVFNEAILLAPESQKVFLAGKVHSAIQKGLREGTITEHTSTLRDTASAIVQEEATRLMKQSEGQQVIDTRVQRDYPEGGASVELLIEKTRTTNEAIPAKLKESEVRGWQEGYCVDPKQWGVVNSQVGRHLAQIFNPQLQSPQYFENQLLHAVDTASSPIEVQVKTYNTLRDTNERDTPDDIVTLTDLHTFIQLDGYLDRNKPDITRIFTTAQVQCLVKATEFVSTLPQEYTERILGISRAFSRDTFEHIRQKITPRPEDSQLAEVVSERFTELRAEAAELASARIDSLIPNGEVSKNSYVARNLDELITSAQTSFSTLKENELARNKLREIALGILASSVGKDDVVFVAELERALNAEYATAIERQVQSQQAATQANRSIPRNYGLNARAVRSAQERYKQAETDFDQARDYADTLEILFRMEGGKRTHELSSRLKTICENKLLQDICDYLRSLERAKDTLKGKEEEQA